MDPTFTVPLSGTVARHLARTHGHPWLQEAIRDARQEPRGRGYTYFLGGVTPVQGAALISILRADLEMIRSREMVAHEAGVTATSILRAIIRTKAAIGPEGA